MLARCLTVLSKNRSSSRILLSPFLFLLVIDWILKTATSDRRNGMKWTQLDDLDFADDLALLHITTIRYRT